MTKASMLTRTRLAAALVGALAFVPAAHAHQSYNLSGYGSGLAGSTNGNDGSPTADPPATWTNGGEEEYTGNLPAHWIAGIHSSSDLRVEQTGSAVNPPFDSMRDQVNVYNASNDPDLPTDRVLAVGGLSWSDPGNANQGWGHGLDYGLIEVEPLETILAGGAVKLTVTLSDDPSDGVAPQLAFAIYGGWDTSATSNRHQTFTTSPAPVNNPLGSAGLTLLDYAVAAGPGRTISRTIDLDETYDGHFTVFVGALGGVAGQYQITVSAAADTSGSDDDGDGISNAHDACPGTATAVEVDQGGCSQVQFCAAVDNTSKKFKTLCKKADWKNDEPLMSGKQADCMYQKSTNSCVPTP